MVASTTRQSSPPRYQYFLLNKPYGVLCQFSYVEGKTTLSDLGPFPTSVYPVGRLDAASEGLVLLTDDNVVKHRLTDPQYAHPRTYLVQVERVPTPAGLAELRNGVFLSGTKTRPAEVRLLSVPPDLPERPTPIRFRKNVPTAWLEITLREGRNHQVRRMTATIGHPTLRLVRIRIGTLTIADLEPGEHRKLTADEIELLQREIRNFGEEDKPKKGDRFLRGHKKPRRAP